MTRNQPFSLESRRHSAAHVLAMAVLELFPDAKLGVGPAIEEGFYYDFLLPRALAPEDLAELEKRMRAIIAKDLPFTHEKVSPKTAQTFFEKKDQPFKLELIDDFVREGATELGLEKTGEVFTDLCRGGHVESTKDIGVVKLLSIAGAYWRGDEKREQLERIYGATFATQEELDAFLKQREEAEKRDHRKLGVELDLFTFSDLVGPGLPLFTPRGTVIREELENFVQSLQVPMGYQRVRIPHITKKALYETSGHWQKFKDELFKITSREGHEFAVKPMNCPHHTQIYASRKRSYRELPLRFSEVTAVYRDEQTGELSGLSRVRMITQDDAHVFCRMNQVEEEAMKVWDIVDGFYAPFKMPLAVRFSRHDPDHFEKYLGTPAIWKEAEDQMRRIIEKRGATDVIDGAGEAAMYGPKIDFIASDAIGRAWQLATIQLDFNLPERFNLTCVNEEGKEERIVMIHRAISGAVERFMAILIEHYAGKFPTWLSPVQVSVLTIADEYIPYAREVVDALATNGIRVELNDQNETLGKKLRDAKLGKAPYVLVIGKKESEAKTVAVNSRDQGDKGSVQLDDFIRMIKEEIKNRA
ncbi:MAG: threonine--tRNA ligase [Parcubacteria group bacterium]|nr:threonine--tRNA ligase [Parcubacteria group bacterium]